MSYTCEDCANFKLKDRKDNNLIEIPKIGSSFEIVLQGDPAGTDRDYYVIDGFENSQEAIKEFNKTTICIGYLNSQYEEWREWAYKYDKKDLIEPLGDWPGEYYVDPMSKNVRSIMKDCIIELAERGYKIVDFDNVDVFTNVDYVTKAQSVDYFKYLSDVAHSNNMLVSLKNSMLMLDDVKEYCDLAINEQCHEYDECNLYDNFGKAVFNIEYSRKCPYPRYKKAFTIIKKMNLKNGSTVCS